MLTLCLVLFLWRYGQRCPRIDVRRRLPSATIRRHPAKPSWVRREIMRLKALMPEAGCRLIALTFNRRHARHKEIRRRMTVGKSYVAEVVRLHHYEIRAMRRRIKHRIPPPVPRNTIWGMDLTGKGDATGGGHAILGIVDHGTRALVALAVLPDKCSWTLLGHLFLAIGRHGKPGAVRTDNESTLTSRAFCAVLRLAGIRHQRSDPGCPWQNGRIERVFGTLKAKLDRVVVDSRDGLDAALREFRFWYNHVRPHQHLQGRTPAEAWAGIDPYRRPMKEVLWFEAWDGLLQGFCAFRGT